MCAELKLNILQVDSVYSVPLTPINKKSAASVIMLHSLIPLSFVRVCVWKVITALHESNENHMC